MSDRKKQLRYEKQAEIAKAIGHPLRIAIIDFLRDGEQCVCDIAGHVGSERSNVSRHLSLLVRAGLLEYYKDGLKVIYRLKTPCVLEFFSCMSNILKQRARESEDLLKSL
jgi:DNA-binding transcriptional ArsR family regulator